MLPQLAHGSRTVMIAAASTQREIERRIPPDEIWREEWEPIHRGVEGTASCMDGEENILCKLVSFRFYFLKKYHELFRPYNYNKPFRHRRRVVPLSKVFSDSNTDRWEQNRRLIWQLFVATDDGNIDLEVAEVTTWGQVIFSTVGSSI